MRLFLRLIAPWLAVMLTVTAMLSLADRIPSGLTGVPYRARSHATIQEAERAIRASVWLPPFYPEPLRWPPAAIYSTVTPSPVVALHLDASRPSAPSLILCQSIAAPVPAPPRLLPPGQLLTSLPVAIGERPGHIERRFLDGGLEVHDVWWEQGGRRITLRYAGAVDPMLIMARSLERAHR